MGIITVKHFINTSIKYLNRDTNIIEHPVYVQITANRKTTKIRSLTKIIYSESKFNEYINNPNKENINHEELKQEVKTFKDILNYCFDYKSIEIGKHKLTDIIKFYSKSIISEFGKSIFSKSGILMFLLEHKETAPIALFLDNENNTLELLKALEYVTKFDIINKLSETQKELIVNFDSFLEYGTDFSFDSLIYWYNEESKKYFIINSLINKVNNPNQIIETIEPIAKILESNFWLEQINNNN